MNATDDAETMTSAENSSTRDRLAAAYQDYCEINAGDPSPVARVTAMHRLAMLFRTEFPADLEEYWDLNDRLYGIWQRSVGRANPDNQRIFQTTGSTRNGSRRYPFGPDPDLWIQAIWELTRFPLGWRTVVKLDPVSNQNARVTISASPKDIYQYIIQCGPLGESVAEELISTLKNLLSIHPAISLISVPDSFLYLNRHPEFQDFVVAHRDQVNLMSQHWEPFYARQDLERQGVHVNDALGDWTTGLFFTTCRTGMLHTLPTCGIKDRDRVNLLNLMPTPALGPGSEEDLFEPISVSSCSCGLNRLHFRFIPHQATALRPPNGGEIYDPGLAERLESKFLSLQFIQEGKTLNVYYRVEGELCDRDLLEEYFRPYGYQIQWRANDLYMVGTKRPVFYRYPG